MDRPTKKHNAPTGRVVAALAAIAIVIGALLFFMNVNTQRITAQNALYLEGTTEQTSRRVDDLLNSGLSSTCTAVSVYSETLESPEIDPRKAVEIIDSTQFSYCFFTDANGTAYNLDGRTEDVSSLEYFVKGMQGESGICYIQNAAFSDEGIVSFYAPVLYEGRPIAVFSCVYDQELLTNYMTTNFFGVTAATYLCNKDGTIIARSAANEADGTAVFDADPVIHLNADSRTELEDAITNGESGSFNFDASHGIASAYLAELANFDWMVLRIFPESVTTGMLTEANSAGFILVGGVLLAGMVFIISILVQSRRQKDQLLLERQEATRIIDASTNLFSRMFAVDLVNDRYEYLKSTGLDDAIAPTGTYSELRDYWVTVNDKGDIAKVASLLDIDNLKQHLTPDVPYLQSEYRSIRDGEECWLQAYALCIARNEEGVPTDVLVTIQDVTSEKAKEIASRLALEEAFHAAEHASKAKSDFLNSMSHDIRTPMNTIMGLTAIASMHVEGPERVRECLANISLASRHLLSLINEVLDMAKIESGSISLHEEAFDLAESIENLLNIIQPQVAAKDQELRVDIASIEHEHVIGDLTRLQQVFVNIMGNAIKFTPEGGRISMRISELPSRVPDCGCYEFTFSDTGVGMSEEFVKKIFEPFTRANDSRVTNIEGTGLGMAIVKSVVSLMNGTIEVDSELGRGTTFTVTVHLRLRDGVVFDLEDLKGVRVLVVDDDEVACDSAAALLEDIGMDATKKTTGREGVEEVLRASTEGNPYDAVILDWRMPGMSGLEVAKEIRARVEQIPPIIILSGYDWSMIEQDAREVGIDAFLSKPLFRSRLIQVMKRLISDTVVAEVNQKEMLGACAFQGYRVLLVEDNQMAAMIGKEIIEMTGAEVEHVENGQRALDMVLDREPGYYDFVFMDIQMPIMNGYEATEAIRAQAQERPDLATIPIIALSADAFAEDVRRSHAAGMNDHMSKPMEIEVLIEKMEKWLPKKRD